MKILFLSSFSLPNWRIEKSAFTASKNGHEIVFAGRESLGYDNKIFSKFYPISWNTGARYGIPYYSYIVKKQIKKIINEVRPDLIHAHAIFSAKMISDLGIPFVFDDNEHWMKYSKIITEIKKSSDSRNKRKQYLSYFIKKRSASIIPKWVKEIIINNPTITVSENISNELKKIGKTSKLFVVPNFPIKYEIENIAFPKFHDKITSVYQGRDAKSIDSYPHKNIEGLESLFINNNIGNLVFIGWNEHTKQKVFYKNYLPRKEMFIEMSKYDIGLIPWKKHWSHYYLNPNKYAEYAHSGLLVFNTSSLKTISETLKGLNVSIDDQSDLADKISYYNNNIDEMYQKRIKTYEFARKHLLWDNYETNILDAYKAC